MRFFLATLVALTASPTWAQPPAICDELNADFGWQQTAAGVQFSNATTGTGQETTWFWSFGDGQSSALAQPLHAYGAPGSYEVCLYSISLYFNGSAPTTCVDTACAFIVVEDGDPCAGFGASITYQPVAGNPGVVAFAGTVPDGADWLWTFGDGTLNDDVLQGVHTYAGPGNYELCLTAWRLVPGTQTVCADTVCTAVIIEEGDACDQLDAGFVWTSAVNGVAFSNATTGTGFQTTWLWNFGDGSTSADAQPFHTYTSAGTYEVCLLVISMYETSAGVITCTSQSCLTVLVESSDPCDLLDACFVTNDLGNGNFFFDNCSSPWGDLQFVWQFGDGSSSTVPHAEHQYSEPGIYEVCLYAVYGNCVDTICTVVVVEGADPCDSLNACFEPTSIDSDSFVFINCTQPSSAVQYVWHFGDGTNASSVNADHSYTAPGVYNVCLVAYWNNCVDEQCQTITVMEGGDPCQQLEAGFVWTIGSNGVVFSNTTTGTGFQTTWSWNFGDGGTSDNAQPTHAFASPGTYTICLTAISMYETAGGVLSCTSQTCETLVIEGEGPCDPGFGVEMAWNAGPGNMVYFNATANHPDTYFIWYFGDGSQGFGPQATHTYSEPGPHQVCVAGWYYNAASGDSCWAEDCMLISTGSGEGCDPNYAVEFATSIQGNAVVFTAAANHPSVAFHWFFGDGTDGWSGSTVTHLYEPPGPYEVCVVSWYWNEASQDTCWADHCAQVSPFTTGLSNLNDAGVLVQPVPAHDQFTVTGLKSGMTLRLLDLEGRVLRAINSNSSAEVLELGGMAAGIYVLQVEGPGMSFRQRVVVE